MEVGSSVLRVVENLVSTLRLTELLDREDVPISDFSVCISHVPHAAILGYHCDHALGIVPREPIRGTMSSSGIVRAFRYCLLCFDIERSVNHFVFLRPYMYFRAEADDISGGGQDKRTIYSHEIRQEMSAFKNRLIKFGQAIIPISWYCFQPTF